MYTKYSMMDTREAKQNLRKEVRAAQRSLSAEYRESSNSAICAKIIELSMFESCKCFFGFIPMKSVVDIRPVIEYAWMHEKKVIVPLCMPQGQMSLREIRSYRDLEPGAYGIMEPKKSCREVSPDEIDFVLVPCVSCSHDGKRLGNGGGYYDRFLEKYKGAKAILCREKLIREDIPMEEFDAVVTPVITEE